MKVLFLIFLVFIKYSHSDVAQYIPIGKYLTPLNSSTNDDYFYFALNNYNYYDLFYLYLSDKDYSLNKIYYCNSYNIPSQTTIDNCNFYLIDYHFYDVHASSSAKGFFYKINPSSNYLIIKYSGRHSYGIIRARGSFKPYFEEVEVGSKNDTQLSPLNDIYNYFYLYIGLPSTDELYLYFQDMYQDLLDPIYICRSQYSPKYNDIDCIFSPLYYNKKNPEPLYNYLYKVNTTSYRSSYLIVRYSFKSKSSPLYVKCFYKKSLSTVAIVFIAIGGVVFVSFLIAIICHCYKKRAKNLKNLNNSTQTNALIPEQQDAIIQYPEYPSME